MSGSGVKACVLGTSYAIFKKGAFDHLKNPSPKMYC